MYISKHFSTKALSNDVLELQEKMRNFSEMYKVFKERGCNGNNLECTEDDLKLWFVLICYYML